VEAEEDHNEVGSIKLERHEISLKEAKNSFEEFDYQKGLDICLELLRKDFDNHHAHGHILEAFHTLGFQN
jgi:hypothetical protein